MRVTKYTGSQTLSLDDHYVNVSNTSGSAITISLPNPSPVDGQQYYIKATNISSPVIVSSAGSGQMMGNNGVPFSTLTMTLGEVLFLVWSAAENKWLAANTTAGDISVASLTTTGKVTATAGAVIGTTVSASPA